MKIEINHNETAERIQLTPQPHPDGGYSWQADGSECTDAPRWHTADEGLRVAHQLWSSPAWRLEVLEEDE